jgi:hypothetical protein
MTIFELTFFIFKLAPEENQVLQELLKDHKIIVLPDDIEKVSSTYFNVFGTRENEMIHKINRGLVYFIILEMVILLLLLALTVVRIAGINRLKLPMKVYLMKPLFYTFITVAVLIFFQIFVYEFGLRFQYMTLEEIELKIYTKLLKHNLRV